MAVSQEDTMARGLIVLMILSAAALTLTGRAGRPALARSGPAARAVAAPQAPGTYILNRQSGAVQPIDDATQAAWSPDSTRLATAGSSATFGDGLQIIDAASGSGTVVVPADQGSATNLAWSPDGSQLAFLFQGFGSASAGGPGLYLVNADGSGMRQIAASSLVTFVWTPDGTGITVVELLPAEGGQLGEQIVTIDPTTNNVLTTIFSSPSDTCQVFLAWSPDGRYLAYGGIGFHQGCGDGSTLGLYAWDSTSAMTQRLFSGAADAPLWLDGSVVDEVAPLTGAPGPLPIALMSFLPDGSGSTTLADQIPNSFPAPQPPFQVANGEIMYTASGCDSSAAFIIDPGSAPRQLSAPSIYAYRPNLSPDGAAVAWVAAASDGSDLVLAPADGSPTQMLLTGAPGMSILGWSPDGNALAFSITSTQFTDCIR